MTKINYRAYLRFALIVMSSLAAGAQQCKQTSFIGKIMSGESYSHPFATGLSFRLEPLKDDWGWVVSIGGDGSDEDWTSPVTFPIRTGERQVIGTGYGYSVQDKMKQPTVLKFVLTHSDFIEVSRLANETLASPRPEAAGEFIQKIAKLPLGQVTVTPLSYVKGDTPETVRSMKFTVSIIAPITFQSTVVSWTPVVCPKR